MTDYEKTLTAECERLNAEAEAALSLGLLGRYEKLTTRATLLEKLVVKHAVAQRQECGSCG